MTAKNFGATPFDRIAKGSMTLVHTLEEQFFLTEQISSIIFDGTFTSRAQSILICAKSMSMYVYA